MINRLSGPSAIILVALSFWGGIFGAGLTTVQAATDNGSVLVRFKEGKELPATNPAGDRLAQDLQIIRLAVPVGQTSADYIRSLKRQPAIAWVEPEGKLHLTATPNDPRLAEQTAIAQTRLATGWDETQGMNSMIIAVVDSGTDGEHEDLLGRVMAGFNFLTGTDISANTNSDDNGHGTAVAGVIGAVTNNGKGIAGVNWQARLMPLKVTNSLGEATTTSVANAISYAVDRGARVINLSLGTTVDYQVIRSALAYAASRNVVLVAAAGNENGSPILYPAANSEVIAVGSVGSNDLVSSFSNVGPELDLVAPGENILSTALAGGSHIAYNQESGTSFAAPYVAGIASLVASRFPGLPPSQIQDLLQDQADKPAGMAGATFHPSYGYGRVNAARALSIHTSWVSQSSYPALLPGQSSQLEVRLANTGASVWTPETIRLGTDRAADRIPNFIREDRTTHQASGWLAPNRVSLSENQVSPGQVGTFRFYYTVPADIPPGVYREYFRPVAEEITWLEDIGIFWDITVQRLADTYHAAWVSQNSYPTLRAGESYIFEVQLQNTGTASWQAGTVFLGTDRELNRLPVFIREDRVGGQPSGWASANRVTLIDQTVAPGGIGTFRFAYTVPADRTPGVYREYFRAVAEHITWLENLGIFWDVTIRE